MLLILRRGSSDQEIERVLRTLEDQGLPARRLDAAEKPLIHVLGGETRLARRLLKEDRVQALVPTSGPRIRERGRRFYPYHFIGWCAGGLIVLAALVLLTGLFPPGLEGEPDLHRPPSAVDAPWYLHAPAAFLVLFPDSLRWIGWLALLLLAGIAFLLPTLDRSRGERTADRWPVLVPGLAVALVALVLTLRGLLA